MEAILQQLAQLSSDLTERLDHCGLEDLSDYMCKRDEIFASLQQSKPTVAEVSKLHSEVGRILRMDQAIIGRMAVLRSEAKAGMMKLTNGKINKNTYEDTSVEPDSLFFDTRR